MLNDGVPTISSRRECVREWKATTEWMKGRLSIVGVPELERSIISCNDAMADSSGVVMVG